MVLVNMPFSAGSVPTVRLDASDVPDMLALGPFGPRTIEPGQHVGVRRQGMLVVMARERMQLDGFTENRRRVRSPSLPRAGTGS